MGGILINSNPPHCGIPINPIPKDCIPFKIDPLWAPFEPRGGVKIELGGGLCGFRLIRIPRHVGSSTLKILQNHLSRKGLDVAGEIGFANPRGLDFMGVDVIIVGKID